MLALALAATLATLPDVSGSDPDVDDGAALLEAVLRGDRPRSPPCEERTGWIGDDDLREPAPCDDDDGTWLVAPGGAATAGRDNGAD